MIKHTTAKRTRQTTATTKTATKDAKSKPMAMPKVSAAQSKKARMVREWEERSSHVNRVLA